MEKAITSALLIIASIIAATALMNAVLPAASKSSGALLNANTVAANRIRTNIEIVHATGNATSDQITVWVKNIGSRRIIPVNASDIILEAPDGTVTRLPYTSGCSSECWDYMIEPLGSSSDWIDTVTVKFTLSTSVDTGVYSVTVSVSNAVSATKDFSV